jgi:hypothetical protein
MQHDTTILSGSDSVMLSDGEAIHLFDLTGEHIGTFADPGAAWAALDELDAAC